MIRIKPKARPYCENKGATSEIFTTGNAIARLYILDALPLVLILFYHNTINFHHNNSKSLVFLKTENEMMKKFMILLMVLSIGVALYEQTSADKNVYVMVIAIVIFMMGMMKLSSKTPSKNQDKEEDNV